MRLRKLELDEMTPELAEYLRPRVRRLGYLGEFFKFTAHNPDVLLAFMRFTDELKAALPERATEVTALTVATLMDNAYERHQHERLSFRLGFGKDWVREVVALDPARATLMTEVDRAVQAYVMAAVGSRGKDCRESYLRLESAISPREAVAVALLAGRYVAHALVVNTLALAPPAPSIFEVEPV